MKKENFIMLIDYLSIILILSYFVFHIIKLVFVGMFLSIYSINRNSILNFIKVINNIGLGQKKIMKVSKMKIQPKCSDQVLENSEINLVEKIEELGFIPSIDDIDDTNAA